MGSEQSKQFSHLRTEEVAAYVRSLGPEYNVYCDRIIVNEISGEAIDSQDKFFRAMNILTIESPIHQQALLAAWNNFEQEAWEFRKTWHIETQLMLLWMYVSIMEDGMPGFEARKRLIMEKGMDVNVAMVDSMCANDDGSEPTLLCFAAERGRLEMVKVLVEVMGADVSQVDGKGNTPLHYACSLRHFEIISYLVHNYARKSIRNKKNQTARRLAYNSDAIELHNQPGFPHGRRVIEYTPGESESCLIRCVTRQRERMRRRRAVYRFYLMWRR